MKKLYNNILILSILSLAIFSCDDELDDLRPFTEGDPTTFFTSVGNFQTGVDGIYSQFYNYYASSNSGMQAIPDILSDNVILVQTGRKSNEVFYDFRYTPNTGGFLTLVFSEAYEAVNAANLIIGQIDNLPDSDDKDNILGQALAARALAHFDLVRTYAKIPTQDAGAANSPGIVYMKVEDGDTGDPFAQFPREPVSSNYKEIIGDLEAAGKLIAENNGEGRLNKNSVYGLLSRVYLYNGEYDKAVDAANEVTADFVKAANLQALYNDEIDTGLLIQFAVNTSSESSFSNVGVLYSQSNDNGTIPEYAADYDFINSVSSNDLRKPVMVFTGTNQGNDYNAVKKFLGETGQVNGLVDIKALRAAEVLLNKAEAQYKSPNYSDSQALATLDELRNDRYTSFTGGETGAALEAAIEFERRVELSFEGHRFFDIKRNGESITRSTAGDIKDGSGTPAEVRVLSSSDPRFQLPIPIGEINANPKFDPNPGY